MRTPNQNELLRMIESYLDGSASDKQISTVEQYYNLFDDEPDLLDGYSDNEILSTHDRIRGAISMKIQANEKSLIGWPRRFMSIAAIVFLVLGLGVYLYNLKYVKKPTLPSMPLITDVAPGGNKAVLTLTDGRKIPLMDESVRKFPEQSGVKISAVGDSALVYQSTQKKIAESNFNLLTTPNGGQYQITLPDGTKVWLNTSSSLRFPLRFSEDQRAVELDGEAYFEVAKNKDKPFMVKTHLQVVEVLGTRFNVNAYKDEPIERTSLLEGRVIVTNALFKSKRILRPGQQSIMKDQKEIFIANVDTDEAVAWRYGYFVFDNEKLESILRKISRWYNIKIDYSRAPVVTNLVFSGTLSRDNNVSKVLDKLQLTQSVRFEILGNSILVLPYGAKDAR
jgi:transmembrane sensor